ncbi:hypothetical protein NC652_006523 [Populus alba x Populus x berolinensis]|nr:hypothetical protein NC652_006523 [Populus alba x Populus x berolinensis]
MLTGFETSKLYAFQDMKFKDMTIPKEINIQISIPIVQLNPDLWEADAHQFNPKRFAKGILWASTNPQAYMSFTRLGWCLHPCRSTLCMAEMLFYYSSYQSLASHLPSIPSFPTVQAGCASLGRCYPPY